MGESKQISFGPFRLDGADARLWRGNEIISLRPKAFAVLEYLSSRPGQLVTKDELLETVWPGTCVTDTVLKVCIREIRDALGDDAAIPKFVQTAHRRGYRFLAETSAFEQKHPDRSDKERAVAGIAVLPFKPLERDVNDVYLAFGIADALITRLSNLKHMVVRPTSAVRKYVESDLDPVSAGKELRVGSVLEGTLHRAGDTIRLTVQLIDIEAERPIWADKFDAKFTDIFDVEDSISERVAEALSSELTGRDRDLLTKRHTGSTAAYEPYVKGRYYWTKRTSDGAKRAIEYFHQAIDLDPNYALAYSGLADCYSQLSWIGLVSPADVFPQARAAALKSLELDNLLAEGHTSLAWVRVLYDWEWLDAEREFKRAIELNSNYGIAHVWYAVQLVAMGRFDESIVEITRAQEIDPLSPLINTIMGWPYYYLGRYDEAIAHYKKALELTPGYLPARILSSSAYAMLGEFSKAITEVQELRAQDDMPWLLARLGSAHAAAGNKKNTRGVLKELDALSRSVYVSPGDIAEIHALLGDTEQAFEWLERAYRDRSSWLIFSKVEPKFETLRTDSRFDDLLRRIGLN
jgi:TolB-like protein/Tfp pilus assembly protein PilF